jgi:hypothetical protein
VNIDPAVKAHLDQVAEAMRAGATVGEIEQRFGSAVVPFAVALVHAASRFTPEELEARRNATRRAPVQGEHLGRSTYRKPRAILDLPGGTIAWSEHEEAWRVYADCGHGNQSAERVAERGGFSFFELVDLLGRPPRTWAPR